MLFKIKEPIWKTRSVGLAEHKLESNNTIEIIYQNKDGVRLFPNQYSITKEKALTYPIQFVSNKRIKLRIIPINDLDLFEGGNNE